jgi:hypothetical protein
VATFAVVLFVPIYIVINLSCLVYYLRYQRQEFNWFLHGLIPIVGVLAFIPAFFAAAGFKVFSFIAPLSHPFNFAGPAAAIWTGLGLLYLVILYVAKRERVRDTAKVFLEEPGPEVAV